MMAQTFGIDISKWQGNFDFDRAVAEGVKFVVLRGAYSKEKDSKFESYYAAARARNLAVGVYQYSMATTVAQAQEEAEWFSKNVLKGKQFELPVYIDVEDATQRALERRLLTDLVKAWCAYLEKNKFWVGIYSSKSFFDSNLYDGELQSFAHWVAQWDTACTYKPVEVLGMWQFGGETNLIRTNKVAGVTCDQDYMLVDYPTMIKAAGKNGLGGSGSVSEGYLSGTDTGRGTDMLIRYTSAYGSSTRTNQYGFEVGIDRNGIALSNPVWGQGNMAIPQGGFVLSGHGAAGVWLYGHVKENNQVQVVNNQVTVQKVCKRTADGLNTGRGEDQMIVFNKGSATTTNPYGFEVAVGSDGRAQARPVYGKGKMAIPKGGFVLSGHGAAGVWLYGHVQEGTMVEFDPSSLVISIG